MAAVTAWALATWAKVTLVLALGVLLAWLTLSTYWFWFVTALAVLAECYTLRQLAREWADEARLRCWWWNR
jgi:hypothetical protein